MKRFMKELRRRMKQGIWLTRREHATLDGVNHRIRNALKEGRGIRLTKEELQVLGMYGLQAVQRSEYDEWDDDE